MIDPSDLYPDFGDSILVVYDLADPLQWAAGEERQAWGRGRSVIHALTDDGILIEYKPGGALEVRGGEVARRSGAHAHA